MVGGLHAEALGRFMPLALAGVAQIPVGADGNADHGQGKQTQHGQTGAAVVSAGFLVGIFLRGHVPHLSTFPQGVLFGLENGLEQIVQHGFFADEDIRGHHHAGDDGQQLVMVGNGVFAGAHLDQIEVVAPCPRWCRR